MFQTLVGKFWCFMLTEKIHFLVPLAMVSRASLGVAASIPSNSPNYCTIEVLSLCNERLAIVLARTTSMQNHCFSLS